MSPKQQHTLTLSTSFKRILYLSLLLQLAGQANCHPTLLPREYNGRDQPQNQVGFSRWETVQTEKKINVLGVAVVERCKLSFTPISMHDAPAVQVVKSCTFEPASGSLGDSAGQCGSTSLITVTITSTSTGVSPTSTTTTPLSTTNPSPVVNASSTSLSGATNSSILGSASSTAIVSQSTIAPVTNATITTSSTNPPITLSFTSLPAPSTTSPTATSSPSSVISTTSATSPPPTSTPSSLSSNPSSSSSLDATPAAAQTPESNLSSTITSTTFLPGMTSPANNAAAPPPRQSSALPKVIGAFAGVAVLLLIIGGTIGYLKMKKLNKKEEEPIRWPIT